MYEPNSPLHWQSKDETTNWPWPKSIEVGSVSRAIESASLMAVKRFILCVSGPPSTITACCSVSTCDFVEEAEVVKAFVAFDDIRCDNLPGDFVMKLIVVYCDTEWWCYGGQWLYFCRDPDLVIVSISFSWRALWLLCFPWEFLIEKQRVEWESKNRVVRRWRQEQNRTFTRGSSQFWSRLQDRSLRPSQWYLFSRNIMSHKILQ